MYDTYENDLPIGKIIIIVAAILGAITLYAVEMNAINSARDLDISAFGDNLIVLLLVGIVLTIGAIFWKAVFGNNKFGGIR